MYNNNSYLNRFSTSNSTYGSNIVKNYAYGSSTFGYGSSKMPSGLQNLTNTCYMSAVLQVLFLILKQQKFPITKHSQNVTHAFFDLKKTHDLNDYKMFKRIVQDKIEIVKGWEEQDAHEFLISLLEVLSDQNLRPRKEGKINLAYNQKELIQNNWKIFVNEMLKMQNSQIIQLFYGEALRQFTCPKNHKKHKFERYQHLSLPIPQSKNSYSYSYSYSYMPQQYKVSQLVNHYLNDQKIEDLLCQECKLKHTFNQQIVLYTLPKYLILHIARFKKSYFSSHQKNNAYIKFNQVQKFQQYKGKKQVEYKLFGIINHYGSLNRGHYICQVKINGEWYQINDQKVTTLSGIKSYGNQSKQVYMLIYQRSY